MTHSPEPWTLDIWEESLRGDRYSQRWINSADGHPVLLVDNVVKQCEEQHKANMERIVACVNACQGIPTERLNEIEAAWVIYERSEDDR